MIADAQRISVEQERDDAMYALTALVEEHNADPRFPSTSVEECLQSARDMRERVSATR